MCILHLHALYKPWQHLMRNMAPQIDLRFTNPDQGSLAVVVAPVLRFLDVGFNADIRIEELGPPEKLIGGFAPELFGSPLQVLGCSFTSSASSLQETDFAARHSWLQVGKETLCDHLKHAPPRQHGLMERDICNLCDCKRMQRHLYG